MRVCRRRLWRRLACIEACLHNLANTEGYADEDEVEEELFATRMQMALPLTPHVPNGLESTSRTGCAATAALSARDAGSAAAKCAKRAALSTLIGLPLARWNGSRTVPAQGQLGACSRGDADERHLLTLALYLHHQAAANWSEDILQKWRSSPGGQESETVGGWQYPRKTLRCGGRRLCGPLRPGH